MVVTKTARYTTAILYVLFISYLFFLPGSALPKVGWLDAIFFDKWVHIGLFSALVCVWMWALNSSKVQQITVVLATAALYGMLVEVVQHYLIVNRSFDLSDWLADMVGAALGLWVWKRYIKK